MTLLMRLLALCVLMTSGSAFAQQPIDDRPNFLIIVADDLGWSDLGFLGSEIKTPHLDALAARGVFMSNFYVSPTCSPTRAMLMTGVSNHAAGLGAMHHLQAPNQVGHLEYGAELHDGVITIAEALRADGYRTMLSGKWHLAISEEQRPDRRGFDRAFGLVEGGASHFADQMLISPNETVTYEEDGEPVDLQPDFYSTVDYTDKIIEYIDETGDSPFFAYLPYTAPHDPLQVPDEWLDRYEGVFDAGPEPFETAIRERLGELDLLPADAGRGPVANAPKWLPSHKASWAERGAAERDSDARRMEIYAAMVELLDQQIGRVLSHLQETGKLDNTYVLFFSDNGASAGTPFVYPGSTRDWVHKAFDLSEEKMGQIGSYTTMGREWAHVSNSPFRLYKGTVGEGGVRSPFIVAGAGVPQSIIQDTPAHVTDIVPTLLDLAGVTTTDSPLYAGKLQPVGQSLFPLWTGNAYDDDRMLINSLFGQRMVRVGNWKAAYIPPPFGSAKWELFDIVADPGETADLSGEHPELMAQINQAYETYAQQNGVIEPRPYFSVKLSAGFEGHCDWWCQTKFGVADTLINPDRRRRAFITGGGGLLAILTGILFIWRRKSASREKA